MTNERKGVAVLLAGYVIAVGFAALFSGSVAAPLTAVPVAIAGGSWAGWYLTRD
jgi:hypothetical protein